MQEQLQIATETLKEMVGKAVKGASDNKLIPLTSLMNISVKEGKFTLTTTDATNYFYVGYNKTVECADFEITVLAETFTRLIQKTTSQMITLTVNPTYLEVKGNGVYKFELPLDEVGKVIKFPKKLPDNINDFSSTIKKTTVEKILNYNKASLSTSVELPCLTSYYCGKFVMTSNRITVVKTNTELFEEPQLITAPVMELLSVIAGEDIEVTTLDDCVVFCGEQANYSDIVYSPIVTGVNTFPVSALNTLIDTSFSSMCKISKSAILDLLDRLSLFVTKYDKKAISLTFSKDGLIFNSKQSSGVEIINYADVQDFSDFTCMISIELLQQHISVQTGEYIEMYYGSDMAIKMVCGDVVQVVALMEDDAEV